MAVRTIGLEIKIDGVSKTVSSIKELETEIQNLQQRLKGVAIGSDEFKRLQGELRAASGELEDFNKRSEGISLERQIEAVGKFTGGVTAGFAAATAAAQLLGAEQESQEQITKAATTAQNLLTVALGARAIAEVAVSANTLIQVASTKAATLATTAQTIATRGLTANLRALYATLLANPYTAILAVVGALAAAYLAFSDSVDEAAVSLEKLQNAAQNTNQEIARQKLLDEQQVLLAEKRGASEQEIARLRQQGVDNERRMLTLLQQQLNNQIARLSNLKATGRATKEELDLLQQLNKDYITTTNSLITLGNQQLKNEIEITNEKKKQREEQARINKERRAESRALEISLIENQTLRELATLEEKFNTDLDKIDKTRKQDRLNLEKKYNQDRAKIYETFFKTIDDLQEENFLSESDKFALSQKRTLEQFQKFFQDYFEIYDTEYFKKNIILERLTQKQRTDAVEFANKQIIEGLKSLNELQENLGKQNLNNQIELYEREFKQFETAELNKFKSFVEFREKEKILQGQNRDLTFIEQSRLAAIVKLETDRYQKSLELLRKINIERLKLVNEITQAEKKSNEEVLQNDKQYFTDLLKLQETYKGDKERLDREITNLDNQRKLRDLQTEKKLVDEKIRIYEKYNQDLNALNTRRAQLEGRLTTEFGGPFIEGITPQEDLAAIQGELARVKKQINDYVAGVIDPVELEKLKNRALELQTAINTATNVKPADDSFQTALGNIQTYLQTFSNAINTIGQLTQTQFSMQLEKLESDYQKTMDNIVGDTVEANAKRTEAEKIYQEKKKQIEKQARISSLQATLIQTIASAAQAVVTTLANPNLGPAGKAIIIGIEGLLATASIATIRQQIAQAQALRRGGKIKKQMATGGMVVGPSHEQGGVNFGRFELEGGEAVINRQSSLNYGGLLSSINESGGGRPIINNVLDSRLVEVLAKGRQEPIRAYVFESDITNAQTINRKLEQLTTL